MGTQYFDITTIFRRATLSAREFCPFEDGLFGDVENTDPAAFSIQPGR